MYKVVQHYGLVNIQTRQPAIPNLNCVKFQSKYWIVAFLWKLFNYDLVADPAWKTSFVWKIIKSENNVC